MSLLTSILRFSIHLTGLVCAMLLLTAQSHPDRQYQVKAAFLYNFTQFVKWPSEIFPEPNAPLVIAVVGEDPFGSYLDEVVFGERIDGHPLAVQRFGPDDEIEDCHILYINLSDREEIQEVIEKVKGK